MKKALIIISIVLGVFVLLFGGFYALISIPKTVDVTWTEEDYASYLKKVEGIALPEDEQDKFNLTNIYNGKIVSKGNKQVQREFTNEEISAALSKANDEKGPIKNIKIRFLGENKAEASFRISPNLIETIRDRASTGTGWMVDLLEEKPVYLKARVEVDSEKTVRADVLDVSIGRLPLPSSIRSTIEEEAVPAINKMLGNYDGFAIQQLRFDKDKLVFVGKVPETIDSTIPVGQISE